MRSQTRRAWRPSRGWLEGRLVVAFARVRAFVARRLPRLASVTWEWCGKINRTRDRRAFMHWGHRRRVVCVGAGAERLAPGYQIGLFLHEFGHAATGKGDAEADAWVFRELGIAILYKGSLKLEWVGTGAIREAKI